MGWRQRAARQMDRDGIRRLSPGEISPKPGKDRCQHFETFDGVSIGCKSRQRYVVRGVGKRCFRHASEHASTGEELATAYVALGEIERDIRATGDA